MRNDDTLFSRRSCPPFHVALAPFLPPSLSLSLSPSRCPLARSSICASYYHCRGPGHLLSRPRLDFFWQFPAAMLHGLLCFCRERSFHRVEDFRLFSHDATSRRVVSSENHHLSTAHESSPSACHSSVNPHQALSCVCVCVCVCAPCTSYHISHNLPYRPPISSPPFPKKRFHLSHHLHHRLLLLLLLLLFTIPTIIRRRRRQG